MTKQETVGGRIHRLREERGMSIQELADKCHASAGAVWSWGTQGNRKPRMPTMKLVAEALGTTVMYLLKGGSDPPPTAVAAAAGGKGGGGSTAATLNDLRERLREVAAELNGTTADRVTVTISIAA